MFHCLLLRSGILIHGNSLLLSIPVPFLRLTLQCWICAPGGSGVESSADFPDLSHSVCGFRLPPDAQPGGRRCFDFLETVVFRDL